MNINEFPQQVNQVISIAETILQGMIVILLFYHLDKEYPKIIRELLERESKVVLKD